MREFLSIVSALDLSDARKTRISLDNIHLSALGALLSSTKGAELIRELAATPELHHDIYAVATKRSALAKIDAMLKEDGHIRARLAGVLRTQSMDLRPRLELRFS